MTPRMLVTLLSGMMCSMAHASIMSGADALINQVSPTMNIGIQVFDLTTGVPLFQRNATRLFVPASNMKLFSDAAALMILGPDYRFKNDLSAKASSLQQGILQGDLYLRLSGDPSFTHQRLNLLLQSLQRFPVQRIKGHVIIDSSHANVTPYAPGWLTEDFTYDYGAPLAPVMIDANRTLVTVNPADAPGHPAVVEVDDASGTIQVHNEVATRSGDAHCGVSFVMDNENQLHVRGCVKVGQWAVQQKMAIKNPLLYAAGLLKQTLALNHIILDGNVILGHAAPGAMVLATDTSKPVAQLMADTLKPSDNLYADSLFLHAAAALRGYPVNWPEAKTLVTAFLSKQTGIDLKGAVLTDGSGLSRQDRITPAETVALLRYLYERFPLTYEYISALPVSGRDGTLQRRFKTPTMQDLVRAKTGTMRGITSLSGYLFTRNAHTIAFAMFINRLPNTPVSVSGRSRWLIDSLCSYFLRQEPSERAWAKIFSGAPRIQFQLHPTQAESQRHEDARWRQLETVVKAALKGHAVAVLYRPHELVLQDHEHDAATVMNIMQRLKKRYVFAVSLASETYPQSGSAAVLWTQRVPASGEPRRLWTLREAVNG